MRKVEGEEILNFIRMSIERRGMPPTIREISSWFGVSHIAIVYHLKKLKKEGKIKFRNVKSKRAARGIRLV